MTPDANDNIRHLRDYALPPDIEPLDLERLFKDGNYREYRRLVSRTRDIEPITKDRRGTEMIGGWCIVASIMLVLVALALAVWP